MEAYLRHDMCGLRRPGKKAKEIEQKQVDKCLPAHVQYACRYWVEYLLCFEESAREAVRLIAREVDAFLEIHLLH